IGGIVQRVVERVAKNASDFSRTRIVLAILLRKFGRGVIVSRERVVVHADAPDELLLGNRPPDPQKERDDKQRQEATRAGVALAAKKAGISRKRPVAFH